jgi:hypothetical protein
VPPALRIALALIVGVVVGALVNTALIMLGPALIPPPAGADVTTAEGLRASMHLLQPRHFAMPFLAHALGTLVGAFVAAALVVARRAFVAYGVGVIFLAGGIAASVMIPAPTWFKALDLAAAYIPMAGLGLTLANRVTPTTTG